MEKQGTEWWIKKLTNAWEKKEHINYAQLMFNLYLKLDHQELNEVLSQVRVNQIDYGYVVSEYPSAERD